MCALSEPENAADLGRYYVYPAAVCAAAAALPLTNVWADNVYMEIMNISIAMEIIG